MRLTQVEGTPEFHQCTPDSCGGCRAAWSFPEGGTYLNHGSFGPSPLSVRHERHMWTERLESQPMDFFLRHMEVELDVAGDRLAELVGAKSRDLVFVQNATAGMNIVAQSVKLQVDDEVLVTNHEYGAVMRIWRNACQQHGARVTVGRLPEQFSSADEVVESLFAAVTPRTRLIVISQITSPTAVILPVKQVCRRAREQGIEVCVDAPHAVGMLPVDLKKLGCDYYTASCHKWLSAPFGSGFLWVHPRRQSQIRPAIVSWGGSLSGRASNWKDEFNWSGTYDPAGYLAIPQAINFLDTFGWEAFRQQTHDLAAYARREIVALTEREPYVADSPEWYGSMISLPLPPGKTPAPAHGRRDELQSILWEKYGIEIPIVHWQGKRFVRVSCHLYNTSTDIDRLVEALRSEQAHCE